MYGLNDPLLEGLRAIVLIALLVYLVGYGRHLRFFSHPGSRWIVAGFGLLLFATLLDVSDELPGLERYVVIGATDVEAFLETFCGYLAGFMALFIGFYKIIPSIAKLEKVGNELRESEEKFRSVFETIPEVIGLTRLSDGLVIDLNPAFEELTGIPREQLIGRSSLEANVWHDPADRGRMVQGVLEHGMIRNLEARFNTGDGRVRDSLVSARLLTLQGQPHILTVYKDITERKEVVRALQESEEKFHSVFETIPDVVSITRLRDGLVIDLNSAIQELTGIPRENFIGRSSIDMKAWANPADRERMVKAVLEQGSIRNMEAQLNSGNDQVLDCLVSARLMQLQGEPHILAVFKDITERKRVEESLRQSEATFRKLFSESSDAILLIDSAGVFVECNQAALDLLKMTRQQFLLLPPAQISPEFQPDGRRSAESAPEMIALAYSKGLHRFDWTCVNAEGGEFIVEVSLMPIVINGQTMLHTTWRDITGRKQVEAALRESEERYRTLFYSSPDPAWIIDNQRFVECNQAAIDMLGYPDKDSLRDTHPSELSPEFQPDGEPSYNKAECMMLIAREKGINRFEWVHRRRDQSDFFAEVTLSSLTLQGRQVLYCTWRDITERKQAEVVLLEMDRMKSDFISTAAHELRTPLATMLGYTELLRSPEDFGRFSEEQRGEFLEEVYSKGETLSRIIDEMLDISRIESGLLIALDCQPHEPRSLLNKISQQFQVKSPKHLFRLDFPGHQPEVVSCDLHRITQVLENLVSNAVKYSPRGGTVTMRGEIVDAAYVVSVDDEGIGMTPEQQARVFDKFYRADSSNTAISGLGLGMSIARQIVEAHGGRIWVESEPGRGAKASFSLPLG